MKLPDERPTIDAIVDAAKASWHSRVMESLLPLLPETGTTLRELLRDGTLWLVRYRNGIMVRADAWSSRTSKLLKFYGGVWKQRPAGFYFEAVPPLLAEDLHAAETERGVVVRNLLERVESLRALPITPPEITDIAEWVLLAVVRGLEEAGHPGHTPTYAEAVQSIREQLEKNAQAEMDEAWKKLCDYTLDEIRGRLLRHLESPQEDLREVLRAQGTLHEGQIAVIVESHTRRLMSQVLRRQVMALGGDRYLWRTRMDERVRHSHADLNGYVVSWAHPPEASPGRHAHPGEEWGCRCVALPLFDWEENPTNSKQP